MDPNAIAELLQSASQGGAIPPVPETMNENPEKEEMKGSSENYEGGEDCSPYMVEALDKLQNMGIPFVGDIVHLLMKGGGSMQSWQTLLKTIDAYGKHKNALVAENIGGGQKSGAEVNNPQPPGSYQF